MKHTIKLLPLAFMLATILTLTGCPGPVNTVDVWDDGVVTTEPTCTKEGVKTYHCSNGETRTETIPALGHNFEGGYCERCRKYEFENNTYIVKVFTSREEFLSEVGSGEGNNNLSTPYEEVYYSFEEPPYISVNELISLKNRFKGKNIIMAYDTDYYGDWEGFVGIECYSLDEKGFRIDDIFNPIVLISNE